jgi:hypothetical protein
VQGRKERGHREPRQPHDCVNSKTMHTHCGSAAKQLADLTAETERGVCARTWFSTVDAYSSSQGVAPALRTTSTLVQDGACGNDTDVAAAPAATASATCRFRFMAPLSRLRASK